jgi:hypothetical protein
MAAGLDGSEILPFGVERLNPRHRGDVVAVDGEAVGSAWMLTEALP